MATATGGLGTRSAAAERRFEEPLDTTIRLVTPERITFEFPLAGPFRRALAYIIDLVVMGMLLFGAFIAATVLSLGAAAGIGLWLAILFLTAFFYGAFFEAVFNGQTPGKRSLGLRVVSDQGVPINATQAVLRNLLWGLDGIILGYIPAIACMIMTKRFQRLGDLAAGTMVMVERPAERGVLLKIDEPAVREVLEHLPVRVEAGPEMARALSDYVKRRGLFGRARREEMAGHLARQLVARYEVPPAASADAVLCAMYHRVFLGS